MELSHEKINKIVLTVIIVAMLVILAWAAYFVYQDVYKVIILVPEVENLKTKLSFEIVRLDIFEKIQNHLKQKKEVGLEINWTKLKSPF